MKRNRKGSLPMAVGNMFWGLLISWIAAIAICVIGAMMMASGTIGDGDGDYIALLALMVGSFAGAIPAKIRSESKQGIWCLIQGALFFMTLLLVGTLLFESSLSAVGVTALVTVGVAAVVALLGRKGKKGVTKMRRKYKTGAFV